jgi:aminoglycoside/choline kinase family phosphotransferase
MPFHAHVKKLTPNSVSKMIDLESVFNPSRYSRMSDWVSRDLDLADIKIVPLAADAGLRRYFRISPENRPTYVLMDAPVEHNDIKQFKYVANLIRSSGIDSPEIISENTAEGFLILTDLGDKTYLEALNVNTADRLFDEATDALVKWQLASNPTALPEYTEKILLSELNLFTDWYLGKHKGLTLQDTKLTALNNVFQKIIARNRSETFVFVHRDFMPRNLMVTENNPGVLDFQDALYGPISYDVISLFKDAFISWEEEQVLDWTIKYWERAKKASLPVPHDFGVFYEQVEWMGVQRHLKVLGIFARLNYRDGKSSYISDTPRFVSYILAVARRYQELKPLVSILEDVEDSPSSTGFTF